MKKEKMSYWLDDLLDQPENQHEQPDGSMLYGCIDDEPKIWEKYYWTKKKNALVMLWQSINPFNDHRSVMKCCLYLMHPGLYKLFFPFSYIGQVISNMCSDNKELRIQTLENSILVSLIIEMSLMFIVVLIIIGIHFLWTNVISPLFQ